MPSFFLETVSNCFFEEVVLALLLEKFEFSLSDKPIIWLMTGIATPHLSKESKVPRMPMIVKLAN